jgi:hypothetical protein
MTWWRFLPVPWIEHGITWAGELARIMIRRASESARRALRPQVNVLPPLMRR